MRLLIALPDDPGAIGPVLRLQGVERADEVGDEVEVDPKMVSEERWSRT
ncbi:hypothetical protein ACVBEG_26880 [Pseudomonas sp. GG8]